MWRNGSSSGPRPTPSWAAPPPTRWCRTKCRARCASPALARRRPLRGLCTPIHGLVRRRAGVPRRGARPLSRFVGRTQELALLHARLAQAVGGQGQVIGIAGEPGLGKSRLLAEFAYCLEGQAVTYCEGHCLAYGSATPVPADARPAPAALGPPRQAPAPTMHRHHRSSGCARPGWRPRTRRFCCSTSWTCPWI